MSNVECRFSFNIQHLTFNIPPMPSRVAIVRGLRTPFAKSGTVYARLTALDLGKMAVAELIERSGIDPKTVQEVVFGNVIPSVKAPNIAREIVLGTGLPRK